jgi:hypothetical protein
MRIFIVGAMVATLLLGLPAVTGHAGGTCPASVSQFEAWPITGAVGDPAPRPGEEPIWDEFVRRLQLEGYDSAQEFADAFGYASVDALYTEVLGAWLGIDKNGDRVVCIKAFPPHQKGQPAYNGNFVDDVASVPS